MIRWRRSFLPGNRIRDTAGLLIGEACPILRLRARGKPVSVSFQIDPEQVSRFIDGCHARICENLQLYPNEELRAAKAFYGGVLGLNHVSTDDFALVYESGGIPIRVVRVPDFKPGPIAILGWRVDDLEKTVAALKARPSGSSEPLIKQDAAGICRFSGSRGSRIRTATCFQYRPSSAAGINIENHERPIRLPRLRDSVCQRCLGDLAFYEEALGLTRRDRG